MIDMSLAISRVTSSGTLVDGALSNRSGGPFEVLFAQITNTSASAMVVEFRDGGAGGLVRFTLAAPANSSFEMQDAPSVFLTNVYANIVSGAGEVSIGWR
jgi:hypothetical protein